jgi:D-alanyl-D-alanine endopeptidase (penicillin-binding protein 7)
MAISNQIKIIIASVLLIHGWTNAATSVWVYNQTQNTVVLNQNANTVSSIASITKLMTAMVALDHDPVLARNITLSNRVGSKLSPGLYTRRQLVDAMLIRSDNAAAETLAQDYPGGRLAFVRAMNRRAAELGMKSTRFHDPSGLSMFNVSTPYEVGIMLKTVNQYAMIRSISTQLEIKLALNKKSVQYLNTNHATLSKFENIVVSKTGFTNIAGFCMAVVVNKHNQEFVIVILGEKNKRDRANAVEKIIQMIS